MLLTYLNAPMVTYSVGYYRQERNVSSGVRSSRPTIGA